MTTVVIIAAGDGTRWGQDVPKHLVEIDGERLLDRTVRLALQQGAQRVVVVGPAGDDRYRVPGAELAHPDPAADRFGAGGAKKFADSRPAWNPDGRTVLAYGDVWFSDAAMATIVGDQRRHWMHYCRPGRSDWTGCRYGEVFAVGFWPEHIDEYWSAIERVNSRWQAGQLRRAGGWEIYRAMCGAPDALMRRHRMYRRHTVIDDFTEDFDYPADLVRWLRKRGDTMQQIMIAVRPGTVYVDGRRQMVRKGRTTAHASHPIVVNHPRMWAPIQVDYPMPDDDTDQVEVTTLGSPDPEFLSTSPAPEATTTNPVELTTPEPTPEPAQVSSPEPKPAEVRAWAREQGIEVSASGKVAADVVEQYKAAHA